MQEKENKINQTAGTPCSCVKGALPENSVVGEYRLLSVLSQNGEGITYLARDNAVGDTVQIREFFPQSMVSREQETGRVEPLSDCATKFKYFRASFMDLYQTLRAEKENECLLCVIQIIEQNNTVYAVGECRGLQTLEEYLQQKGGKESWYQAKKYLLPLYRSLSSLHKKGITHQGICPQNILLDEQQRPVLKGLALSELRAVKGELGSELFDGYSAPEQYQSENWKGTWTDVYSVAAVTYRVLTGKEPPPACERLKEDTLIPAAQAEESVPEHVSDALSEAMEPLEDRRYDNMDLFIEKMLESTSSNTAVFRVEDTKNQSTVRLEQEEQKEAQRSGKTYVVITMMATLLVLVLGAPKLYRYINDSWAAFSGDFSWEDDQKEQELALPEEEKQMHTVENFVGKKLDDVLYDPKYDPWYYFQTEQEYSETFEKGTIIRQSVSSGTQIGRKTTLTLYVSKGSQQEPLPDLTGRTLEEATAILSQMGKQWKVVEGESDVMQPGSVFRTEPPAGTQLNKGKSEQIILYVASEQPQEQPLEQKKPEEDDTQILSQKNSDRKVIKKKEKKDSED